MTLEPEAQREAPPGTQPGDGEARYGVSDEQVRAVQEALAADQAEEVRRLFGALHAADAADLLEWLSNDERSAAIAILRPALDPEIVSHIDETVRDQIIEELDPATIAEVVLQLDSDDQIDLLEDLDEEDQRDVLREVPAADRVAIEQALAYPEDSAGRLMQRELVAVPENWTVGDAIDFARNAEELPDDFYDLFVVDPKHRPVGSIPLSRVLRTRRPASLSSLMDQDLRTIPVTMDQEEVAYLFRQYALVSAPVVDEAGRLVGVITVDDVVHVIDEEAEEDLMRLSGIAEDDLFDAALTTTRLRFPWLTLNLLTAVAASVVIGLFEDTIQRLVALAVLMPIVASMGGNAGTQTLAVAVRGLATKDLTPANALRILGKETLVGSVNGLLFAVLTGVLAWLWFGDPGVGVVIAAATVITLLIAGVAGMVIPIGLERLKVDPAIASTVFLTTVTDIVGFFSFLGLAALFLR